MDIDVDASAVDAALSNMLGQIKAFPDKMGEELTAWQVEDMHRHFPNTERSDDNTVETEIWPRSRTWHRAPTGKPPGRPLGGRTLAPTLKPQRGIRAAFGSRPILREELWDSLVERMRNLLLSKISWSGDGS